MNGYTLLRNWFDFSFENPDKVSSIQTAFYCYLIDLWNRLGQKEKIGIPTENTMQALNIHSYKTYKKTLDFLCNEGFIKMVYKSSNQYKANVIALVKNTKANTKALDKANTIASTEAHTTIIEQVNKETNKQTNKEYVEEKNPPLPKPPKIKKPPNPEFVSCIDYWLKEFHKDWTFTKAKGTALNSIIKKIKDTVKKAGNEITETTVIDTFKIICLRLPEFYKNKDLEIIDQKFNEIVTEIKTNSNGTSKNKQTSIYRTETAIG